MERISALSKRNSIISMVNGTGRFFTMALLIFMMINLAFTFLFEKRYEDFVGEIESVIAQKPVIYDDIPNEIWEVIVGRKTVADCEALAMIDAVDEKLTHSSDAPEDTELLVVRRTLETMRQYVTRIETNILNSVSIDESQALLGELRNVGSLGRDLVEDYIANRISREAGENHKARLMFIVCWLVEIALWGVMILVFIRINHHLSGFIEGQIRQLERFAGQIADGELNTRAPDMKTRELMPLTQSLNTMAVRLNGLIEQNKQEQENLKRAELRMLQAQINPHFLYNTLDAIMWQAEAKNTEAVIHITRALSDFFRISLSSGEEWITVSQEQRHLEGYLSIQKVRYRDILSYSIAFDEDIENEIVPKLLLQPLVENAIYHGIKLKRGGGKITVVGKREGGSLYFCVQDTGPGMSPERLEEVRRALRQENVQMDSSTGSGFGLKNVDLRIRLYYSQQEGLQIESDAGGTRISFRVPAGLEGKKHV
ncbi:MAG: sensor histidine kinase [Clostridia bacterium]|nr:sensor histidine kinase [Clostridia bacterium]